MARSFACRDYGELSDCAAVMRGETEEEAIKQALEVKAGCDDRGPYGPSRARIS